MSGRIPDVHSHFRGTHLHHLNYGIVLLAGVGALLLFNRPTGRWLSVTSVLYGVGLALTFDEFGMWLHLNADYWQRASFDAVRSEEHTSELQSLAYLVCRLLLEKKKKHM